MELSDQQRRAVERTGQDVCVVAGPGSGKTRVLVERFAWLVEQQGVAPEAILAITFTEKAATEIKQRLVDRFADQPDVRESIERAWVATIDGFCARLLQGHAIAAGLAPDFRVLDQPSADRLAREAAEEALQQLYEERPAEMRQLLEAVDLATGDDGRQSDLAGGVLNVYESMRLSAAREIPPPELALDVFEEARTLARKIVAASARGEQGARLREWASEFLALAPSPITRQHFEVLDRFDFNLNKLGGSNLNASRLKKEVVKPLEAQWVSAWDSGSRALLAEAVSRVDRVYRESKRRQAAVDFADLVEHTIQLLESGDEGARQACARFQHVLMDELQDTNRLQWRLVDLVRGASARFFGVGDVNQSIYGFRHADPEVFAEYRAAILTGGGLIDELDENYRSRQEILDSVSRALDGQPGIEPRPLTAMRRFDPPTGPAVELLEGQGESPADTEAAMVAARIRRLVADGACKYSDVAILLRTLNSTQPFEQAFDRFGIPFLLAGGRTFLEARETRDLLALLAALVNPLDEIALLGVLRSPLMGLGDEEIYRIGREQWQFVFEERFGRVQRLAGIHPPDLLITIALDECGYAAALPERARANIDKFLSWLRREYRDRPRPLAEMLVDLESLRFARAEAQAPPPESGDVVRMMTIHSAKGLEFPVVFVSALQKATSKQVEPLLFSPRHGLGIRWRNPVTGKAVSDATHRALRDARSQKESEEENRLLYVAMTRAEDRLILSQAPGKQLGPWQKRAAAAIPDPTVATVPPTPDGAALMSASDKPADQFLERPESSGQYDSSVSVTSVAMFAACPRKYYLGRYLGLKPKPQSPGTGAIELGLEVHRALAGESAADWDGQVTESPEALELKERFEASELGQRAARALRIGREFDFLLNCEDVIVSGQIDLWFEENGELVLVDYKTDRDESGHQAYALQLRLYALALERYAGRLPDRAVLYYLRTNHAVDIDLFDAHLREAQAAVRALRDAQDRLEFPLNEGDQCGRCPFYRGLCPAGQGATEC
jgi:ATP-dependent helicase/nuclease subunit A